MVDDGQNPQQTQTVIQGSAINTAESSVTQIGNNGQIYITQDSNHPNVKELKTSLKNLYEALKLPQDQWLSEGQGMDFDKFYMQLQLESNKSRLQLENIFPKSDPWWKILFRKRNNRFLLEAPPGFGKTTIATKLLHDWAMEKPYLKKFKLAFKISLKNLPDGGIDESMAKTCGLEMKPLHKIIKSRKDRVLIILDGFDELPEEKRQLILPILFRRVYPKAIVLITARSGEGNIKPEDLDKAFGQSALKPQFEDFKYQILGLDNSYVESFLLRLKPYVDDASNIEQLQAVINVNPGLFTCPLFVMLLTRSCTNDDSVEKINSKFKLYKFLFNCILKRGLSKFDKSCEDIDLFQDPSCSNSEYQRKMKDFGEIALKQMIKSKLQFKLCPISEEIHQLGFLVKYTRVGIFSTESYFEVFQFEMLQFLVAYSLWYDFLLGQQVEENIRYFYSQLLDSGKMPLTLYFFCNLCGREKLLEYLAPFENYEKLFCESWENNFNY